MTTNADKKRVLLVDDEQDINEVNAWTLENAGFSPVATTYPARALELLRTEPFDAIVCDLRMPEMNGIQLLGTLRRLDIETPVVILTGQGTLEATAQALRLGAFDFLVKPCAPERLVAAVSDAAAYGYLVRNLEAELRLLLADAAVPAEAGHRVRLLQREILVVRKRREALTKRSA